MQNLQRRSNGVWYVRTQVAGRDIWRSLRVRDEKAARKLLKETLGEIRDDAAAAAAPEVEAAPTWEDAVVAWQELILETKKPSYRKRLLVSLRQVGPHFQGESVGELDVPDFTDYVRERLADGRSISTIKADFTVIAGILDAAVMSGWRPYNPLPGALKRVLEYQRPLIEPPRARDIIHFAQWCGGMFGAWVRFQARTGLRQQNGVSLTRPQISLREGTMTFVHTKTGLPIVIRMNPQVRRQVEGLPRAPRPKKGEKSRPDYVFWHDDGEPFRNIASVFRARMRRWAEETGRRPFRCHDLRHFFAIRSLQNGSMKIFELQKHLGHSSVKTTEMFYLRWLTEHPDWKG